MKKQNHTCYILIFLLFSFISANCQDNYASNVRTTITSDQRLLIHYDIVVNDGSEFFKVLLDFTYEGEKITPNPNNLYGEYGRAMTPGNKIVYWNHKEFGGDISKVEVKVIAYKESMPVAQFKDSIGNNGFAPCEVIFINLSTNADRYEWEFGDPNSGLDNISYEENPIHTFKSKGIYHIKLSAVNTKLDVSHEFIETILVKGHDETIADFQITGYNREVPVKIEFRNISKNADSFLWNFDDPRSGDKNNISTEESPEHKYVEDGKYVVSLTAKNSVSGYADKISKEVLLIRPTMGANNKHKTYKAIWLGGGIVSFGIGAYTLTKSIQYADEARTSNNDDYYRDKSRNYAIVSGISFGVGALCGVEVYIQSKKQKEAAKQLAIQLIPIQEGTKLSFTYKF